MSLFVDPHRDNAFPWLSPETGATLVAYLLHDIPHFEKLLRGETSPRWIQNDDDAACSWKLEAGSWSPVDALFNVFAEVVARRSLAYPFDCNDATTVEVLAADGATVIPKKDFYLQAIDWVATQLERALVRASTTCSDKDVTTFRAVLHIITEPVGKKTTTTFCDVLCRRPGTKKYSYTRQGTLGQEAAVQSTQLKNRCLALLKATPRHGHLKPQIPCDSVPIDPSSVPRPLVNPYRGNVFPWLSPESGETLVSYLLIDPDRFKRIIASHDNVPGWEVTDALDGVFSEFINRRSLAYMCDSYDATTVQVIRAVTPTREIDLVQKDDFYLQAIDWVATQLERAMRANVHLDEYGQRVLDSMNETLDANHRRVDILCRRPGWTPKRKRDALTHAQEAVVQAAELKRRCLVSLKEGRHGQLLTGDEAVIYKKARDRIATRRFAETSKARNQHFWGLFGRTGMSAQVSFDAALGKPVVLHVEHVEHEPQISQGGDEIGELGLGH